MIGVGGTRRAVLAGVACVAFVTAGCHRSAHTKAVSPIASVGHPYIDSAVASPKPQPFQLLSRHNTSLELGVTVDKDGCQALARVDVAQRANDIVVTVLVGHREGVTVCVPVAVQRPVSVATPPTAGHAIIDGATGQPPTR